jgi:O-antigen/teichoic acid export membrane protein
VARHSHGTPQGVVGGPIGSVIRLRVFVPAKRGRGHRSPEAAQLQSGSRWIAGGSAFIGLLNYGYALLLANALRPRDYANFAAAQALLLVAATIAASAVPWVLTYQLATDRANTAARHAAISFAWRANAVGGTCAALVIAVVASQVLSVAGLAAVAAATIGMFLATTPCGWLMAEHRFAAFAQLRVLEVVVKIVVGTALWALFGGSTGPLAGFAVGSGAVLLLGSIAMRHDLAIRRRGSSLSGLLRMTFGMTAIKGLVAALASVDVVVVALLPFAATTAGSYQVAVLLARIPMFIASGIAAVIFPLLASTTSRRELERKALEMYAAVTVPLLAVVVTMPVKIIHLVLPISYRETSSLLPLLGPSGTAIGLVVIDITLLQAAQRYRTALARQMPGLVVAVVAAVAGGMIGGIRGLAIGTLIGTVTNAALLRRATRRRQRSPAAIPRWSGPVLLALTCLLFAVRAYPAYWFAAATVCVLSGTYLAMVRKPTRGPTADPRFSTTIS